MLDAVVVGVGFAGHAHWMPALQKSQDLKLIGVVDPLLERRRAATDLALDIWAVPSVAEMADRAPRDAIIFVVTPDHLPVITELLELGYRALAVEKPIVSRDLDAPKLRDLIRHYRPRIYAVDHYYQKFLPLEYVLGLLPKNDPRVAALVASGQHTLDELPGCLGEIEGVTYTNIEAGELGIPYLDTHPWLEHDAEIGGIIRDLGPHAFSPLWRNRLVSATAEILDVGLVRLSTDRKRYEPVRKQGEIEMYARVLLLHNEITVNVTFGKAPFPGKERSLAVRASQGTFFAGLARGQSSVVLTNDGRTTRISLSKAENSLTVEEAELFYTGQLPSFDGNLEAAIGALEIGQQIRAVYFISRQ